MTIAAGFRCRDGIIFGADTYEAIGDMRDRVHKIPMMSEDYCTAMITGACSDGHLMDTIIERCFDAIHEARPDTHVELGKLLRGTLLEFYRSDMQVFPEWNKTSISLLIAASLPSEPKVEAWCSHSSVIRKMKNSDVLGFGVFIRYVLQHLFVDQMPLDDGTLVMNQLLSLAKDRVSFVGGDCYISVLTPQSYSTENATLSSLEDEALYDYFLSNARRLILATGNRRLSEEQYEKVFAEFHADIKHYRNKLIRSSSSEFRARLMDKRNPTEENPQGKQ